MSKTKSPATLELPEPDVKVIKEQVPRVVYKCTRCLCEHTVRAHGYAMYRCATCTKPMEVSFPDRNYD